jgi:integrase/recombinase XerD
MFETLFQRPEVIAHHQRAPFAEERRRDLVHCAQQEYSHATLLFKARELLWVAYKLSLYPDLRLPLEQVEAVARTWEERRRCYGQSLNEYWTHRRFMEVARPWLRFLGCLHEPVEPLPFAERLETSVTWMAQERGLAATTIERSQSYLGQFLRWYGVRGQSLTDVRLTDIETFLSEGGTKGWCRVSVHNMAAVLRGFFRYGATQGWCPATLAPAIQGPRLFAFEPLPIGPDWSDVQRLLASLDTDRAGDIRDRAILMLFAVYGLRASEVAQLHLDDLDWERDLIRVQRAKRQGPQTSPLVATVGNALIRYVRQVRPGCLHREIFRPLLPPIRPLCRRALYSLPRNRFEALGLQAVHRGPHALRHSCAARLAAEGLSLNAIGDHLGHRSPSATRIYAKVDLPALRHVAAFDLGDLLCSLRNLLPRISP